VALKGSCRRCSEVPGFPRRSQVRGLGRQAWIACPKWQKGGVHGRVVDGSSGDPEGVVGIFLKPPAGVHPRVCACGLDESCYRFRLTPIPSLHMLKVLCYVWLLKYIYASQKFQLT
jgi:hypothetical protein